MPFNAPPLCPLQVEARERIGGRSHREQLTPPAVNEPLWIDEGEGAGGGPRGGWCQDVVGRTASNSLRLQSTSRSGSMKVRG